MTARRLPGIMLSLLVALSLNSPRLLAREPIDRYRVLLMTMGPGAAVYERFGHNAIVIIDTVAKQEWVYNYGSFDFDQPGFVRRFVEGRPLYWLGVADWESTLRAYQFYQRRVEVQELALRPEQKAELALRLARNAEPENREYLYDYFRDNCSTRVRDMLDQVLAGALRRATVGVPAEGTFRFHTARSLTNDLPMYLGILTALGPSVDRPMDQWDEMFLPAKVQERVRELRVVDEQGRDVPLVTREATVLDLNVYSVEAAPPDRRLPMLAAGLVLALLILSGLAPGRVAVIGRVLACGWALLAGIAGIVLAFLWLGTNHVATAGNRNLLILSPLWLLVIPIYWSGKRRRLSGYLPLVVGCMAILGLVLASWFELGGQRNLEIALLTAPPSLAAAWLAKWISRRPVRAP